MAAQKNVLLLLPLPNRLRNYTMSTQKKYPASLILLGLIILTVSDTQ